MSEKKRVIFHLDMEHKQNRKKETKKAVAKTAEIIIPDQPLLENSI